MTKSHTKTDQTRNARDTKKTNATNRDESLLEQPTAIDRRLNDGPADYERLRRKVEHEDNLINHRLTWLLFSQGFLFVAYTTIAPTDKTLANKRAVLCAIAVVGYVLSLSGFFSLKAAFKSLRNLSSQRPDIRHEERNFENILGSAWGIPLLTMLVWAFLVATIWGSLDVPVLTKNNIIAGTVFSLALAITLVLLRGVLRLHKEVPRIEKVPRK